MPKVNYTGYLRLMLLLQNAGLFFLRAILSKYIKSLNNESVDTLLKPFKSSLKRVPEVQNRFDELFPDGRDSDIEQWDITLLVAVLIHCCTLETKIDMKQLKKLFNKTHINIDSLLADKENVDKINAIKERISVYQYKTIFRPNYTPSTNQLDDWGVDLLLKVMVATCQMGKDDDIREVMKSGIKNQLYIELNGNETPRLDTFLKRYKSKLTKKQNGIITDDRFQQIFPDSKNPDFNKWETEVLLFVVLGIFESLSQSTINGIKKIRNLRNVLSHPSSTSMQQEEFDLRWAEVYKTFEELVIEEIPSDIEKLSTIAKECGKKEVNLKQGAVTQILEDSRAEQIKAAKDVQKKIIQTNADDINANETKEVKLEIRVIAPNEQLEQIAETRIKELFDNKDDAVSFIIEKIEIVDIQTGCVALVVSYSSLKQLLKLIEFVYGDELQNALDNIAYKVEPELDSTISVSAYIPWHELQRLRHDIELILQDKQPHTTLSKGTTARTISNSIDALTNHDIEEGFKLLSVKLSKELGQDIKVYPMLESSLFRDDCSKEDIYKKVLRKCYTSLVSDMEPRSIIDRFHEIEFLPYRTLRDIQENPTTSEKNRAIVDKVLTKGKKGYTDFKKCLKKTEQAHLADRLTEVENQQKQGARPKHTSKESQPMQQGQSRPQTTKQAIPEPIQQHRPQPTQLARPQPTHQPTVQPIQQSTQLQGPQQPQVFTAAPLKDTVNMAGHGEEIPSSTEAANVPVQRTEIASAATPLSKRELHGSNNAAADSDVKQHWTNSSYGNPYYRPSSRPSTSSLSSSDISTRRRGATPQTHSTPPSPVTHSYNERLKSVGYTPPPTPPTVRTPKTKYPITPPPKKKNLLFPEYPTISRSKSQESQLAYKVQDIDPVRSGKKKQVKDFNLGSNTKVNLGGSHDILSFRRHSNEQDAGGSRRPSGPASPIITSPIHSPPFVQGGQASDEIRWELISLYRDEEHLSTPVFPLTPLEKVNIEEMYVKPNMECKHEAIENYKGIFKDKRKKIYVVGDAGLGKTALCQKMVSTWCQVHSETVENMSNDQQAMAQFDFLFYVSLRDANTQDFNDTNVVDMIKHQMCELSEQFHEQLPSVLKNEKCLIILDGLDEWTLERKTASQVNKGIPGRQAILNCTVLTTTRPWKLEAIQLASNQIDAKIELLGIAQPSSDQLIQTMIQHLNETNNSNMQTEDFESELNASNLNPFRTIPVVLKQLVCLWHAGKPLGHTKCAIYSQMVEFLLELSQPRLNQDPKCLEEKNEWTSSQIVLPSCFDGNATSICQEFKPVLVGLGRVAFKTLLNENQESSLVFKRLEAEIHGMKAEDINICLSIGILSQSAIVKDTRSHRKLSFLHKTYQEFLAAVYLSRLTDKTDEHADCVQTLKQTCNSKARCLEMKNIIAFISGVSSTTTTTCELIAHITPLVNTDPDSIYSNPSGLHEYLINCLLEGWRCSHNNKHLLCRSITIEKDLEHMDLLCEANIHQTKILLIRSPPTAPCLKYLLQMDILEKLYIGDPFNFNPPVISENSVYTLIQNNTNTLTQVDIQNVTLRSRTQLSLLLNNIPHLSEFSIWGITVSQHLLDSLQNLKAQRPHITVDILGRNTILPDTECTD